MFTNDKVSYYKFGSIEEINACKLMYKEDSLYWQLLLGWWERHLNRETFHSSNSKTFHQTVRQDSVPAYCMKLSEWVERCGTWLCQRVPTSTQLRAITCLSGRQYIHRVDVLKQQQTRCNINSFTVTLWVVLRGWLVQTVCITEHPYSPMHGRKKLKLQCMKQIQQNSLSLITKQSLILHKYLQY